MIHHRKLATFLVISAAALLAACSAGKTTVSEPVPPGSLTVEPLANDDPIYRQARVLMQESSQDGQWVMNVVERGTKPFADRQVVLTRAGNGQGYALPQLKNLVEASETWGKGWPSGEWVEEDAFTFTEDGYPGRGLPMFTLHVQAVDATDDVAVTLERGQAFPAGQWGVSNAVPSGGRP